MNKKPYLHATSSIVSLINGNDIIHNIESMTYNPKDRIAHLKLTNGSSLEIEDPNFYFSKTCTGAYMHMEKAAHRYDVEYCWLASSLVYGNQPQYSKVNLEECAPINYTLVPTEDFIPKIYSTDFDYKNLSLRDYNK